MVEVPTTTIPSEMGNQFTRTSSQAMSGTGWFQRHILHPTVQGTEAVTGVIKSGIDPINEAVRDTNSALNDIVGEGGGLVDSVGELAKSVEDIAYAYGKIDSMFGGSSNVPGAATSWREDVDLAAQKQNQLATGSVQPSIPTTQASNSKAAYTSPSSKASPKKKRAGPYKKQRNKRTRR